MYSRLVLSTMLSTLLAVHLSYASFPSQYAIYDLGDIRLATIAHDDSRVVGLWQFGGAEYAVQLYPSFQILYQIQPGTPNATSNGFIVGVKGFQLSTQQFATHGFLYLTSLNQIQDLGSFAGFDFTSATCVNPDRDIFGFGETSEGTAPLQWINGVFQRLPTLFGMEGGIEACNDVGDASGWSHTPQNTYHCTIWKVSGGMQSCHPSGATTSLAKDMNAQNQVAEDVWINGYQRGALWSNFGIQWLHPYYGDTHSYVNGTNDIGSTVGKSCKFDTPAGVCQAIRWDNGYPIQLSPMVVNPQGWNLVSAVGTSNDEFILVEGTLNGQPRVGLLVPYDQTFVHYWSPILETWSKQTKDYWRSVRDYYR